MAVRRHEDSPERILRARTGHAPGYIGLFRGQEDGQHLPLENLASAISRFEDVPDFSCLPI